MFTVDKKVVALLIGIPIAYTLMFGGLFYYNSLTDIPIIVCNLDEGAYGRRVVRDLYNTPDVRVVEVEGDPIDIERRMVAMKTFGAVVIPNDFSRQIAVGGSTSIELIIDNTNRSVGSTVSKGVQSVVATLGAELIAAQLPTVARVSMSSRILYNPTIGYEDFFLAALIIHSVQIALVFSIAPSIVDEKFSVAKPIPFLAARLITYSMIEIAVLGICLAIGLGAFHIKCAGNPTEILMLGSTFVICMTAFALMVGAWINIDFKAVLSPLIYVMPSILFAGVTWPRSSMDDFSLFLSYVMPIGYIAEDFRAMLVKGVAGDWTKHALILLAIGAAFFSVSMIGMIRHAKVNGTRIAGAGH